MKAMLFQRISERRACEIIGLNRSSIRYKHKTCSALKERIAQKVLEMASSYSCYGYKTITQLLKRLGYIVNKKRVFRIWQENNLALPQRKKRKKRHILWERPHKAEAADDVWCYDFLYIRTEHGEILKILVVLDEYTRECLGIKVDRRINSEAVTVVLAEIIQRRKKPRYVRSDNGPEFISKKLRQWLSKRRIRPQYIEPGKPWQNGFIESFNARFRAECLNREMFWSRAEAQTVCNWWRQVYNYFRPHSSLDGKTPAEMGSGASNTPLRLPLNLTRSVKMIY